MHIGITLRNMGPQSSVEVLIECARCADEAGLESLWVTDHIAIPPDDSQGSDGRYLDPLVTLGFLAAHTERIQLGTGVLILPYRTALPTAKQLATLQELSRSRLLLGVGVGWMDPEFRALGLDRHQRGAQSDELLAFFNKCFDNDVVEANGQPFLFRPRPPKPPIYVGGAAPHALRRAARYADGWLPMGLEPESLADPMESYHALCAAAGKPAGDVTVMRALPLADPVACHDLLAAYESAGVTRVVCAVRYEAAIDYAEQVAALAAVVAA